MTMRRTAVILLILPILFFGIGAIIARGATQVAELVAPKADTLLDAASLGQSGAIFRMLSAGDDPGLPVQLDRPLLHWKRGDVTSPILVAVAVGDITEVAYMFRHTQRMAEPPNDTALCLAAQFGHSNIVRFLIKKGVPPVPRNGCGEIERPEDVALKFGSAGLAKELRQFRLEAH
jgi:ankyrin repeat protein